MHNSFSRPPLNLFIGLSNAILGDQDRFVAVVPAVAKGIDEGTRAASADVKAALVATRTGFVRDIPGGYEGVQTVVGHRTDNACLGFKFNTYPDGGLSFEMMGGAGDLRTMAAVLDMAAAALAEMDSHSMQNDWAATHRPSTATPN